MERTEALLQFREKEKDRILSYREVFMKGLLEQVERLYTTVIGVFREVSELAHAREKESILFFYFSLLKVDVINRKYTVLLQAQDNRWYLDERPIEVYFCLDFLFEPCNDLWDELLMVSKKYVGIIHSYDVREMILEELKEYNTAIAYVLRFVLRDIEQQECFWAIPKSTYWVIRWGEYRHTAEILIQVDRESKTQTQWEFEVKKSEKEPNCLACSYWYQGEFIDYKSKCKNLQFICFDQCKLSEFDFTGADLSGGKFIETSLKDCSFVGCNVMDVDFTSCKFEEVNFNDADVTGAAFSFGSLRSLLLSPEQLKVILIKEEVSDAIF